MACVEPVPLPLAESGDCNLLLCSNNRRIAKILMLGRRRAVDSANALSLLLALFFVVACGGSNTATDPTGVPSATMIPTDTPPESVSSDPSRQELSTPTRQQVYGAIDSLQMGFLPLSQHTDEFYSTMLPNGEISVDMFGQAAALEAVELWFSVDAPAENSYRVIEALVGTFVPDRQEEGFQWVLDSVGVIAEGDIEKVQTSIGGMYLTLQLVPNLRSFFLSLDTEQLD